MLITVKTHLWQQQCVLSSRNASILEIQSCVLPWGWAWYKSWGSPHYSVEFFHRKVESLSFLLPPCPNYREMQFRPEKDFWTLLWPESHSCLICASVSEIPSGPQVSCYCFWLSLVLSIKTCEEWFPAETSPVQLTSACLGERSWFWLIWAKPSLEECSCCTSLAEPHKATFSSPHLSELSARYWSYPWASCSCMPSPVSRLLPPGDVSQAEQEEECCKPKVVWRKHHSYKVWRDKTTDSALEYMKLTGSSVL